MIKVQERAFNHFIEIEAELGLLSKDLIIDRYVYICPTDGSINFSLFYDKCEMCVCICNTEYGYFIENEHGRDIVQVDGNGDFNQLHKDIKEFLNLD